MFNLGHNLYMIISAIITIAVLILLSRFAKEQRHKDFALKFFAVLTVVIHYSSVYVSFFQTGTPEVGVSMILPNYPCNVAMWLLLITAFMKNKNGKAFKLLAEMTFYLGVVGGILGVVVNESYASTPTFTDYEVLKGMLSHSTMLIGVLFLLVGNYIRIRVDNMVSIFSVLVLLLIDGGIIIGICKLTGYDAAELNPMYLIEKPFEDLAWLNTGTIGLISLAVGILITVTYEQIALKEEERWYTVLKNKYEERHQR
ncbi:MAG: YwaF family protein [Clostridia bacterium]|nr:YwaF family protein [Clostridia bacterium]